MTKALDHTAMVSGNDGYLNNYKCTSEEVEKTVGVIYDRRYPVVEGQEHSSTVR